MIPQAELHVHLEFAILPSLIKKLAKRNKVKIPTKVYGKNETFVWKDFLDFLKLTDIIGQAIRTPEDYYDITYDYLMRSAKAGAIYIEFMPSPDHAAAQGLSYDDQMQAITKAMEDAKRESGIESRMMIVAVRHYGVRQCEKLARLVAKNPYPLVTGFGLAGDEAGYPPEKFAKTFAIAHEAGLSCSCHAGEWTGPAGIKSAIDALPIKRIGHGVRAIEDKNLIKEIIDRDITLECAPGSNIALGVYPNYQEHPFKRLLKAGVKITLNSDDPPYFNTTLAQEYENAQREFKLSDRTMKQITLWAIEAGFMDEVTKRRLLKRV